ncbi:hypothetical protein V6L77_16570 [Pannonibacter sp. Pt2-lr]
MRPGRRTCAAFPVSGGDNGRRNPYYCGRAGYPGRSGGRTRGRFPPFDPTHFVSQLFWLFVTFLVFYWIMKNVALPRIAGILEDRHDRIAGDLSEAERLKRETDEAIAAYEQALSEPVPVHAELHRTPVRSSRLKRMHAAPPPSRALRPSWQRPMRIFPPSRTRLWPRLVRSPARHLPPWWKL